MEAVRKREPKVKKSKENSFVEEFEDDAAGDIPVIDEDFLESIGIKQVESNTVEAQDELHTEEHVNSTNLQVQGETESEESAVSASADERIEIKAIPVQQNEIRDDIATSSSSVLMKNASEALEKARSILTTAEVAVKPVEHTVSKEKLVIYPSLVEKTEEIQVKPLSRSELKQYFINPEALSLDVIIDQFLEANNSLSFVKHPLHIYLAEYLKALLAFENSLGDLKSLQRTYDDLKVQVWKMTDNRITENGKCADNKTVSAEHFYRQCHMNRTALGELDKTLEKIQHMIYHTSFRFKCNAELVRFQVECFLFDTVRSNPITAKLDESLGIIPRAECIKLSETADLRACIAILFAFHRIPLGSEKFRDDIRRWLTSCVGILLRASTFYDQLFLLNHLLRCPSIVFSWASTFIQLVLPQTFSGKNCGSPFVKHFMAMLRCFLIPIKARNDFLSAFQLHISESESDSDSGWVMVDADSEQELSVSVAVDIQENDVFCLFQQFPFDDLFSIVFGSHAVNLEPFFQISNYDVLALFSFCHEFLETLIEGLDNPSLNKYPRFNKKTAQILRETIVNCKEFWDRLVETKKAIEDPLFRNIQIQFEELILRGMRFLLEHGRNGTLQFLVGWPTKCLSVPNVWRAVVTLENPPHMEFMYNGDIQYWKRQLLNVQVGNKFEEHLQFLDEASATYLLTALSTIIRSCDLSLSDLVQSVTVDLLKLCFLSSLRETYSKIGRDIITSICTSHPYVLSEITSFVRRNLDQIGSMSIYLFQEMPLKLWQPTRSDAESVCEWLVNASSIQDVQCLLAREILSNLNWEVSESGELNLHYSIHYYVAVAIVEAFMKFISVKNRRNLLYEGLLKLSDMIATGKSTPEQQFVGWCWEVLLELKLHRLTQFKWALNRLKNNSVLDEDVPTLTKDILTVGPLQAARQRQPMACYVAIMMTDVGHSTTGILDQGLDWINALIENYLYLTAMQALQAITPLFFANNQFVYLIQQEQFHLIINSILQADATYLRMVKNLLVTDFPGKNLRSFGNMLVYQLLHSGTSLPLALRMWTRVFTSLKNWNRTKEVLYILNQIVKFAFHAREFETVLSALREAHEEYRQNRPVRGGGVTSLVSWMAVGSYPTFAVIEQNHLAESPWLAYGVLLVEIEFTRYLWHSLLNLITGEKKRTFEECVRKACQETDVSAISVSDLPIYRISQLILDVSVESEVFPLLCQEFFKLFLQRSQNQTSIGDQFFLSSSATRMLKPVKQKLRDAADYYRKRAVALEERSPAFYQDLQHAVKAFSFWIDEPKLHYPNLYLPALPPEYEPELLSTVIHPTFGPWTNFVDMQHLYSAMRTQAEHWLPFEVKPARARTLPLCVPTKIQEAPLPPPAISGISSKNSPFIPVDQICLLDPSKVLFTLRPDLLVIQDAAKAHDIRMNQHIALDIDFMELIADLNDNVNKEKVQYVSCHKSNCAGPAEIKLKFKEFTRNEQVYRNYVQNRDEWLKLVAENPKIDQKKLIVSVIRFEKAISSLVEYQKRHPDDRAAEVGAILFYHMLVFMGAETDQHPLVSKFFSSCLEVLGQHFIANQPKQCANLLDTCLNNQRVVPMLLPHFTPNIVPTELLEMYRKLQTNLQGDKNEILIQLLSAFDIQRWLQDPVVDVNSRLELFHLLSRGISKLGSSPSFQDYPLFETYCHHVRCFLYYRFPIHLIELIRALLELSEQGRFPQNGWISCLFSVLDISLIRDLDSLSVSSLDEQSGNIIRSMQSGKVSVEMAIIVMQELTLFFRDIRKKTKHDLYSAWKSYVNAMAVLFLAFSSITVESELQAEEKLKQVIELYAAWTTSNPFSPVESPFAEMMVGSLRLSCSTLTKNSPKLLPNIWEFIIASIHSEDDFVISVLTTEFVKLDWEKFLPSPMAIEQFLSITTSPARKFVAKLIPRISWKTILSKVADTELDNLSPLIADLTRLIISFAVDPNFRPFSDGVDHFISETSSVDWGHLTSSQLKQAISPLLSNPEELATWNVSGMNEAAIIRMLEIVTQFKEANSNDYSEAVGKRAMFVQVYGRASVAWHTKRDQNAVVRFVKDTLDKMRTLKVNPQHQQTHRIDLKDSRRALNDERSSLLDMVEKIWFSSNLELRYRGYSAAACEIFSWSNYVSDKKMENYLRSAILIWISQSSSSPLLVPMITSCCRCVATLDQMVQFLEVLIDSYFRNRGQVDWTPIIQAVEPPEISTREFVKECLARQCFLALYAHFNKLYQIGRDWEELFAELVEWCKVRPLSENESKDYLLWNQLLILAENLDASMARSPGASPPLNLGMRSFLEIIFTFAEDRGGLLSSIGVGKPTPLSRHFKLIARSLGTVASPLVLGCRSSGKACTLVHDTRHAYETMKARKDYAQFGQAFSTVDSYLSSQGSLSWNDVREMFEKLVKMYFENIQFLTVVWER